MDCIENKFEVISNEWIECYIDKLYEPYKIYGNLDELLANTPKYVFGSNYNGQLKEWNKNGEKSYVIYNPSPNEIDKIRDFRAFEARRKNLIDLKYLQIKYSNKGLTEDEANDIENQIDLIIDEVLGSKNPVLQNDSPKDISTLFREEEYYEEVKNLLIENNLIRIEDEKIEWLGAIEEPSLKSKKLLCTLFIILERKNYFTPQPSNAAIIKIIQGEFGIKISENTYGKAKNSFSSISNKSKDIDYIDFYHFIPKK